MPADLLSYARVKLLIRQRISSGIWKPGEALPSLAKLAALCEVSVGTVRRAVAELAAEGVLETHQGKGISVVDYGRRYWNRFHRFQRLDGSLILEFDDRLILFDMFPADDEIAAQLQLTRGEIVIHWQREMSFDGKISGVDESFLPQKFFSGLKRNVFIERPKDLSIYALYEKTCGVVVAHSSDYVCAELLSKDWAQHLCLPVNTPMLVLKRTSRLPDGRICESRIQRADARFVRIAI